MAADDPGEQLSSKPAKSRDFAILAVIAIVIIGAFILLTFKLIDQEDLHVRNVEKVKMRESFSHDEIGSDEAEKSVAALVGNSGRRQEGDFSTLNLTDELMKKVATIKELEKLDVGHTKITDKSLEYISKLPLRELDLSADAITDAGLSNIAEIPTLRKLTITETGITDEGIAKIARLPNLHILIAAATKISDKGVSALVSVPGLQRLDLTSTVASDACLKDISKMLHLEVLLADSSKVTGAGICKSLRSNTINKVCFAGCRIADADIPGFQTAMPEVRSIDLSSTQITDRGLLNLAKMKNVVVLKVRSITFGNGAVKQFRSLRPDCKLTTDNGI